MHVSTIVPRTASLLAFTLFLTAWSPAPARAATDLQTFDKRVGKSAAATAFPGGRQTVCVCKDGSGNQNRAGILVRISHGVTGGVGISIDCNVVRFDGTTGALSGNDPCGTWELLPK